MNEHLLPGKDRETFTTSEDMVENQTTCVSVVEDKPEHTVAHTKLSNSIYWTYSNKWKNFHQSYMMPMSNKFSSTKFV